MIRLAQRSLPVQRFSRTVRVSPQFIKSFTTYTPRLLATDGSVKSIIPEPKHLGSDKTLESNIKSDTNRLSKTLTRFWENVDTVYKDGKYEVQLDGKALKTPAGFPLAVPERKKQLAYLVAHEWANLPDLKIKTNALPLTSVVSRAIDLQNISDKSVEVTDEMIARVGNLEDIQINLLNYLDTDTCLIFATTKEYEGKFRKRQDELYLPLIKEYEDFFTAYARKNNLLPSPEDKITLETLDCETDGLRGNKQTVTTQNVVFHWLNSIPIMDLIALEKAILTSKSFLCGISLLRSNCTQADTHQELYQPNKSNVDEHYFATIEDLIELANMEIIFQTETWGEVEDTHDVDKEDWLRNLASAAIVCR